MPISPRPLTSNNSYQAWLEEHDSHGTHEEYVAERQEDALSNAVDFLQAFGLNKKIHRSIVDAWLWLRYGEIAPDDHYQMRTEHRRRFLRSVRLVSLRADVMALRGLAPFAVHCAQDEWVIENVATTARRFKPVLKLQSQSRTSSRHQRQIMAGIDAKGDPLTYQAALFGSNMNELCTNVTRLIGEMIHKVNRQQAQFEELLAAAKQETQALIEAGQDGACAQEAPLRLVGR